MKLIKPILLLTVILSASHTFADGASQNVSQASKYSALAVSEGAVASVKIVGGVVAVPLLVVGSVGKVSLSAGKALMKNAVEDTPLIITDVTITADPSPLSVMKKSK